MWHACRRAADGEEAQAGAAGKTAVHSTTLHDRISDKAEALDRPDSSIMSRTPATADRPSPRLNRRRLPCAHSLMNHGPRTISIGSSQLE